MSFTKLPAIDAQHAGLQSGCLTCGPTPTTCPLDAKLTVGFGSCTVTCDDDAVYDAQPNVSWERAPRLRKYEKLARRDPDHDWRVEFYKPLSEEEYQRQGAGQWVLVRKGEGFA